jgi:thiol-disulfide isomerase/thioredoxin
MSMRTHLYRFIVPVLLTCLMLGCGSEENVPPAETDMDNRISKAIREADQKPGEATLDQPISATELTAQPEIDSATPQQDQPQTPASEPPQQELAGDLQMTLEEYQTFTTNRSEKPLFVNFWATWCTPCIEEMPHIIELSQEYKDKMDFLAVSADSFTGTVDQVEKSIDTLKITLPVRVLVADQNTAINTIEADWSGSLPTTFIYDSNGNKAQWLQGPQSKEEFQAAIDQILNPTQ